MKYDLDFLNGSDNVLWGALIEVNQATNGLFIYLLHFLIFAVALYVVFRRTGDTAHSVILSQFITLVLSIILYYGGYLTDVTLVSGAFLFIQLMLMVVHATSVFFGQVDKDGG